METMATTFEPADESTASEVFQRKGKEPTHTLGAVIAASADTCLRYGQPGEKSVGKGFSIVKPY